MTRKQQFCSPVCGLLVLAFAGAPGLYAQDDEDVFELSPFSVMAEENEGYRALSTLAGTRLRTPLKDIAGAVQVVTEEFLEDQGVANVEDLSSIQRTQRYLVQRVISEQAEETDAIQTGQPVFEDWLSLIGLGTSS